MNPVSDSVVAGAGVRFGLPVANDIDSHEHIPAHMWPEVFGPGGEFGATLKLNRIAKNAENSLIRPDIVADDADITDNNVWTIKGPGAPSAIDMTRRPAVLDAMGIHRQLVFPLFGLLGLGIRLDRTSPNWFEDPSSIDRLTVSQLMLDGHNAWAAAVTKAVGERVRPVGLMITESVAQMVRDAELLLGMGLRAIHLAAGIPPAGTSPGDRALDPFWGLLADAGVPVTFHIGSELALFASQSWSANVPEFVPGDNSSHEFPIEPYRGAIIHYCMENYLQAMILAGVFERHPALRVGCMEGCAHWVGPLGERMDMWAGQFAGRLSKTLSMMPSQYLARNVRVAPYPFEPVASYIERYPEMADVYCYSSDFPHFEGGRHSKRAEFAMLEPLGEEVCRKFFYENAAALLPA